MNANEFVAFWEKLNRCPNCTDFSLFKGGARLSRDKTIFDLSYRCVRCSFGFEVQKKLYRITDAKEECGDTISDFPLERYTDDLETLLDLTCPFCGEEEMASRPSTGLYERTTLKVWCDCCGRSWVEHYKVVGYRRAM